MLFFNFKTNSKREQRACCKNPECDESFHSFLEEQEKNPVRYNNKLSMFLIFPIIYLLVSLLMPVILLAIMSTNKLSFKHDIQIDGRVVTSYFDLIQINDIIYKIYCCMANLSGILIVFVLFLTLNQRFKVPEYKDNTIKLYMMILFGLISHMLNLYRGFFVFFKANIIDLGSSFEEHPETLFIGYILFSIFFSIYSLTMIDLLRTQMTKEDYWYIYRVILVSFLSIFTIIYTSFLLYKNHYVTKYSSNNNLISQYMNYVLVMFPYFIHSLNAVMVFSYYFEIKYLNMILTRNLDVDYLFEAEDAKV
jgi:hypothetical protein